ncbi:MAG: iron-sulfur cluster assembly accessory protein [Myxococcales bacterium]|nr:iron-sulfur cluster assembly accessory protein [Myxococcales bacterium]
MAIQLTEKAVEQVRKMMEKHELGEGYGLRVGVKAGGCAGREYLLELQEGPQERDRVYDFEGVTVFCDPKSYLFVNGLVIDFKDSMLGGGFKFDNPNAQSACGCGTSFAV